MTGGVTPQSNVPGLADAEQHVRLVRDAAFLPTTETVSGFELLPMTVEHYTLLSIAGNPLLGKRIPSPAQLVQFLWILSPSYSPIKGAAYQRFLHRCRVFVPVAAPVLFRKWREKRWQKINAEKLATAAKLIDACRAYFFETFQDRPPNSVKKYGSKQEGYSDACWFCATLAREYGWSEAGVLKMPLKRVFQYMNEARLFHDSKAILRDPTAHITGKYLDELNRKEGEK